MAYLFQSGTGLSFKVLCAILIRTLATYQPLVVAGHLHSDFNRKLVVVHTTSLIPPHPMFRDKEHPVRAFLGAARNVDVDHPRLVILYGRISTSSSSRLA